MLWGVIQKEVHKLIHTKEGIPCSHLTYPHWASFCISAVSPSEHGNNEMGISYASILSQIKYVLQLGSVNVNKQVVIVRYP